MHKATERFDVVALCDANEDLRSWAGEEWPGVTFYTDVDEMLKGEALDLVSVVTPHDLHAPIAIKVLEAGANVVVEKPMATTYEDASAMVDAAERAGKFVSVFHNRRLDPWFLAAKSVIDDGLLGRLVEMNTGINYAPKPPRWRAFKKPSGGLQFDWGAHLVDYLLSFAGDDEVETVSGELFRLPETPDDRVEDHAVVHIRFRSGLVGHVTSSALATINPDRYRIVGDKGTLIDHWEWGQEGRVRVDIRLATGAVGEMHVPYPKSNAQAFYDNIAAHMAGAAELLVTGPSAAKVINVLCTSERSAKQGGAPLPLA